MKNPKLISKPFAQNGQKNVIPEKYEASMESNQATWDQGFGQITMLPVSAGGLPPKGQDFNGILNQMCETIVHISKGGVFKFSADYVAAINGYPKGAILQSEDEKKYYQSLIDNNKVNFNTASQEQIKTSWKLVMTDDLLDQLSKKLESSAVVQSTGTSTTSVMSQKASTDAFQPKGSYQPSGDYATNTALIDGLSKKFDKSGGVITGAIKSKGSLETESNIIGVNVLLKSNNTSIQIMTETGSPAITNSRGDKIVSNELPKSSGMLATIDDISRTEIAQSTGASTTSVMSQKASTDAFQPKGSYQPSGDYATN
ncbi:hypothetical protein GWI78_09140, partial [Proteus sp. G2658]|nr:hypothetical protein [Proteus sp. G2658]